MKRTTKSILLLVTFIAVGIVSAYAQPTVAAPTPPARAAAKVVSIFSEAYTNVNVTNFNPGWGQSTVTTQIQFAGNNTLKYANLNYQGTEIAATNALTMNKLHIDVWTADGTTFQITPISPGPKEKLITLTPLVQNQWNSFDIDLSQFTGVDFSNIFQFKVVGNGTVYIDNLYFYDNTTTVDTQAPTAFTATKGAVTSESVELLLNATDNSGAVTYTISYGNTTLTTGGVSGTQKSYAVAGLLGSTDYSFSVICKDATGNAAANNPIVITAKTAAGVPASPAPTRLAANVISIFSDAYTSAAPNANFFPGWGQATVATQVQLAQGNPALKYAGLNYQGMQLETTINASTMMYVHVDVYTENETALQMTPISDAPVKEFLLALSPLSLNTWKGFDIPLTSFTGVDKAKIFQFKFVGSGGKTVYIDNLYFHDGTTAVKNVYQNEAIKVYPSAASTVLNLKSDVEVNQVVISNLVGQTIRSLNINAMQKTIDVSALSAGNYFISIQLENGESVNRKFIKL
jgi:hypothetical protein